MEKPFRWNISKKEQLGSLIEGSYDKPYPDFMEHLRKCCAGILSFSDNSDLIFIGRSPESIFDYMSGILADTTRAEVPLLLNISIRNINSAISSEALSSLKKQLSSCRLSPEDIIGRTRSVTFVDLVYSGKTFKNFMEFLFNWSQESKCDKKGLMKKIRIIGITEQTKTSPKTWRWHQHIQWVGEFRPKEIKNVSIPWVMWDYLGNNQKKVSLQNYPERWGSEDMASPPRNEENINALRLAYGLYEKGTSKEERHIFLSHLAGEKGMKFPWFRSLVNELRSS